MSIAKPKSKTLNTFEDKVRSPHQLFSKVIIRASINTSFAVLLSDYVSSSANVLDLVDVDLPDRL
jgi:hypothetical protein